MCVKIPTGASTWYREAQDRKRWYAAYSEGAREHQQQQKRRQQEARTIECSVCRRMFRREVDMARHKCIAERKRPIHEQRGLVRCSVCRWWFRSRGGLAVHWCSITEESPDVVVDEEAPASTAAETRPNTGTTRRQDGVECSECGRSSAGKET